MDSHFASRCAFFNMRACLTRADNELQHAYSDKTLLATDDFSKHVNIHTPVPVTLWITLSKEGKPNKVSPKPFELCHFIWKF